MAEAEKRQSCATVLHCLEPRLFSADVIAHFKTSSLIKCKHDELYHALNPTKHRIDTSYVFNSSLNLFVLIALIISFRPYSLNNRIVEKL